MNFSRRQTFIFFGVFIAVLLIAVLSPRVRWSVGRVHARTLGRVFPEQIDFTSAESRFRQNHDYQGSLLLENATIRISKRESRLVLYDGDTLIAAYPCVFGSNPDGTKTREGDGRTPVGEYYICTRLDKSQFHLFMGLNYPNPRDAEAGLSSNVIDAETAERVKAAEKSKVAPAWNTALGGAVGIHGGGTPYNWTQGCIAVSDDDIEEIWLATRHWTPVIISE